MRARQVLAVLSLIAAPLSAQQDSPASDRGAAALAEAVSGLGTSARVLMIGAHPDDEDTRLIAWLARGQHVETAYLSLTRGDGGQNLIGNELGEALGVIRTEELLAARRIDGAEQYFTRAYDYGFSKSADEAFRHWPHDTLLGDAVRVVRAFRPHVIVAVFSGTPADGHGQHQASGIVAREVFDAAMDTVKYPSRTFGAPWAPAKFYRDRSYFGAQGATYRFDAGEYDPLLGRSYAELAGISRSQHRSQAMGQVARKGPSPGSLRLEASRLGAVDQDQGLFAGLDTTYARLRGATSAARAYMDSLPNAIDAVRASYDVFDPSKAAAPLGRVLGLAGAAYAALPCEQPSGRESRSCTGAQADAAASLRALRAQARDALLMAAGVTVEAIAAREVVPSNLRGTHGLTVPVEIAVYNRGRLPVRTGSVESPLEGLSTNPGALDVALAPDSVWRRRFDAAGTMPRTEPEWLMVPRRGDMYTVSPEFIAQEASRTDAPTAQVGLEIAGRRTVVTVPIIYRSADPARGEINRPIAVAPAVSVTLDRAAEFAQANTRLDRTVRVTVRSADTARRDVRVSLVLPNGLTADSASRTVTLPGYDAIRTVEFRLRGQLPAGRHTISARAESNGETFERGYTLIDYEHIRPRRVYRAATLDVQAVDVKLPQGLTVAYIRGVSDNLPPILQQLGLDVTEIDPAKLTTTELSRYGVVVVGPRAYEASADLVAHNARLLDYVKAGGTMVVQYGQNEMQNPGIMPYPITLARPADRVTDENSPMQFVDPKSPLLNAPNRITEADFANWVQDRTLYMPRTFDEHYAAPLATNDPGEPLNKGVILAAPYGKGTYIYTTLGLFRELPAGVPGAARLLVNLLAAGSTVTP